MPGAASIWGDQMKPIEHITSCSFNRSTCDICDCGAFRRVASYHPAQQEASWSFWDAWMRHLAAVEKSIVETQKQLAARVAREAPVAGG